MTRTSLVAARRTSAGVRTLWSTLTPASHTG